MMIRTNMHTAIMRLFVNLAFITGICSACNQGGEKGQFLSLNGTWMIAETADTLPPGGFTRSIPVPGLTDLASPPFPSSGYKYSDSFDESSGDSAFRYEYFWYRKELSLDTDPFDFAILKVHKAKFGHAVYVNNHYVGRYDFCYTPSFFDISRYLNFNGKNEILIRVGAHPYAIPDSIPFGWDAEKAVYYSGIYDNVELICGNYPRIENVQIVPDINTQKIGAVIYLENGKDERNFRIKYSVREKGSGRIVAEGSSKAVLLYRDQKRKVSLDIRIPGCRLWSPEDPHLYELCLNTPGDSRTFAFGMREFLFDPGIKMAKLNGKPYYLRGSNIAMQRFLEDSLRQGLPWDSAWVSKMHDQFKDMYWNSHRFHVGFAPEIWYETADEKGFLVQDEYAFWGLAASRGQVRRQKASVLAQEFDRWIRERWNHPSVVIWDAQNETVTEETGKALAKVRDLDLSNRPWDNGWGAPQSESDMIESHPYVIAFTPDMEGGFRRPWPPEGYLKEGLARRPLPFNDVNTYTPPRDSVNFGNPVIVNEYAWIWLYRDGSPTWITDHIWDFYSDFDTPEKRWDWRGRVVAAMTEYWRSRRDIAGVQHFCILSCERRDDPMTQVSDEWKDLGKLVMQPGFKKYVKPAFAPVGLYIDKFDRSYLRGESIEIPVILFNDLYEDWKGDLVFEIRNGEKTISHQVLEDVSIGSLDKADVSMDVILPEKPGNYEMVAEIGFQGEKVFSTRLFKIAYE